MADEELDSPPIPEEAVADIPPRKRRRKWPWIVLGAFVAVPAIVIGLWVWIALSYTYSDGFRAGYVQKFSDKGWLCKTWEGELSMVNVPGAAQERWLFSVRDDSVAALVRQSMGHKVSLAYEEHRGIPTTCFGETNYFIKGVQRVPEP